MSLIPPSDPPQIRPRRGRPSTLDRAAVLDAAWRVVAERGLERTRFIDVAEASGTPVSTLQHAFGTLDDLLRAAIISAGQHDQNFLDSLPPADAATPSERIEAMVVTVFGDDFAYESWVVWLELWRASARDEALAAYTAQAYEPWWNVTEGIIRDGQATGEFTDAVPADDLAVGVVAVIDGCAVALLLRPSGAEAERARRVALSTVRQILAPSR